MDDWDRVDLERRRRKAIELEEKSKLKERIRAQRKLLKKKRKKRRKIIQRRADGEDVDSDTDTDTDTDTDSDTDSDGSDDEDDLGEKMKDFDATTAVNSTRDEKLRTTTRNLRIREDTAKYLLNLDVNSAFYDPKSRSMRDNPTKHLKEEEQGLYKGDNAVRNSGDCNGLTQLTCFAWEAYKHGEKVHDMALPTQAAMMHKLYKERAAKLKDTRQKELIEKYGGNEHLE